MAAPDHITSLSSNASFYDWFNSYNVSAIGKLNKMYVFTANAGDGVGITFDPISGGHTFSISSTINSPITFNGNITFNSAVSLLNDVLVGNVTNVFSGNYTTITGFTIGSVVRLTENGGLTLAIASSRENAESIGIVSECNSTESKVVLIGKISGATLTQNLLGSPNFSTGCVYFLSGTNAGRLTSDEPTTITNVSKPILIATGNNSGIVYPYRGQYLDVTGACGASGGNTIILPINTINETEENFELRIGAVVAFTSSSMDGAYQSPLGSIVKYYRGSSSNVGTEMLGIVSGYVGSYAQNSVVYLVVNTIGSVLDISTLNWDPEIEDGGLIYLNENGDPITDSSVANASIGVAFGDKFLYNPDTFATAIAPVSLTTSSSESKNILINGSLSIWQRKNRGDITGVTWTSGITGGYFADRWCILNENAGGQTFNIVRKEFSPYQTDVTGYPDYYFNLSGITVGANKSFAFENRTQDARSYSNQNLVFSFFARNNSGVTGRVYSPYVKVSKHSTDTPTITYGNDITIDYSGWENYNINLVVPALSGTSFDNESFFAVGLRAKHSNINTDFAQFTLGQGSAVSPTSVNIDDDHKKCSYYYQRSYSPQDPSGSLTTWVNAGVNSSYLNAVGNCAQIYVSDLINLRYEIKLPYRMRSSSVFTNISDSSLPLPSSTLNMVKFYSPYDGRENDVYNISAEMNMSDTQGTTSKNLTEMYAVFGLDPANAQKPTGSYYVTRSYFGSTLSSPINIHPVPNTDGSVDSISVTLNQGYVLFDKLAFHYAIDLDLNQGF